MDNTNENSTNERPRPRPRLAARIRECGPRASNRSVLRNSTRCLPLILFFLFPSPARPATVFGDITVSFDPVPEGRHTHGYTEYRIHVRNGSAERSHRVRLRIPKASTPTRFERIREISRTVDVGPGATATALLWQPELPPLAGTGLAVTIDGREQDDGVPLPVSHGLGGTYGYPYWSGYYPGVVGGTDSPNVFIDRTIDGDLEKWFTVPDRGKNAAAVAPAPATPTPFGPAPVTAGNGLLVSRDDLARADAPVAAWGTSWLGYSRFDGIIVAAPEFDHAPEAVRTALAQYVECGGSLTVLGPCRLPETWHRRKNSHPAYTVYYPGFGECIVTADADLRRWTDARWDGFARAAIASWEQTAAPWRQPRNTSDAVRVFPVVENSTVPIRGLFLLMLGFAVVIGPVNLAVLGRRHRRIWMLWTIPLISLITCAAVFGYTLAVEGWHGELRTEALTLLDDTTHQATTLAWTGVYAPVAPSDGLRFGYDTEVTPHLGDFPRRGGTARTVDWTEDQHVASGWVAARVPVYFMLGKSEARRERISLAREADGSLSMVNGLGADVQEFRYADRDRRVYTARSVPAGARAALQPSSDKPTPGPASQLRRLSRSDWLGIWEIPKTNPLHYLSARTYVAVLDGQPFVEDALRSAKNRRTAGVVYGILGDDAP